MTPHGVRLGWERECCKDEKGRQLAVRAVGMASGPSEEFQIWGRKKIVENDGRDITRSKIHNPTSVCFGPVMHGPLLAGQSGLL